MNAESGKAPSSPSPPRAVPTPDPSGNLPTNAADSTNGNGPVKPADSVVEIGAVGPVPAEQPTIEEKVKTILIGKPLDLADHRVFTQYFPH